MAASFTVTVQGESRSVPAKSKLNEIFPPKHAFIAAKVNGKLCDLQTEIAADSEIVGVLRSDSDGVEIIRHSTAHLMAQAVQELNPKVKVSIGPVIEDGFYYDFDVEPAFTDADLPKIEEKMREIAKRNVAIQRSEVNRQEAVALFKKMDEPYKVEIINDRGEEKIFSLYTQGPWLDLCRGPHVPSTGELKHFKLLKVAGAYWKGDEKNKMLSRIYGTAFEERGALLAHLERLKEAERRDHRRLGKELDLFSLNQEVGPGMILWHPKGARVRLLMEDYWRQAHLKHGYELVYSPHLARASMWETSGHTGFYKDYMYPRMTIEDQEYLVKPMNCPFHLQIYKTHLRSYRELPFRWAELGTVYRYERSGVLHGLMRVRGFTQDDAHLFMRPEQLHDEIVGVIRFTREMLNKFGFDQFDVYLSTRPEKYVGSLDNWELATNALKTALESEKMAYQVDPGEGVFYGPKIDIKIRDSLKRSWQCSTIQVDFNLPERFGLEYVDTDGKRKQPIMLHRALLGSIERFFGVLLEHHAGAFPFWLAPEQVRILTLSSDQQAYAQKLLAKLKEQGLRAELDERGEKLGFKIREAQTQKVPLMIILGEKEMASEKISVRLRNGEAHNEIDWNAFQQLIQTQEKNI